MLNKVQLIGRLGGEPEIRYTTNGKAVANATLATSKTWKKDGEKQEATEWHKLIFWEKLADIVGKYLQKGSLIYVEGSLQTRQWEDKDGNKRYTTEIVCHEMKMLGSKGEAKPETQQAQESLDNEFDSNIPF